MGFISWMLRSAFYKPREIPSRGSENVRRSTTFSSLTKKMAQEEVDVLRYLGELPIAKVLNVMDGDTVLVSLVGDATRVRLDSIDCPEDDQPWGSTAHAGLIKLIGGKLVRMEIHGLDSHGRTLATLYVKKAETAEWMNVNERMLILGHAWVMHMYMDHLPQSRQAKLRRLQDWSRSRNVGLWGTAAPVPPWAWRNAKRNET